MHFFPYTPTTAFRGWQVTVAPKYRTHVSFTLTNSLIIGMFEPWRSENSNSV